MSTKYDSRAKGTDQIGKVFVVRSHGLRECLVCGHLFTRCTAPAHAETNCYPTVELCLLDQKEESMSLSKKYVRDGNRKIIGSVTGGYSGGTSDVVRDDHNDINGRTSDLFRRPAMGAEIWSRPTQAIRVC